MHIYIDESGGIGRGVMTLAALAVEPEVVGELLAEFKRATGLRKELKGSRINMDERAFFFKLFEKKQVRATVGIAVTALRPEPGEDRGSRDAKIYHALLEDVIGALLPETGGCVQILIDDGRYDEVKLAGVRADIAALLGGFGSVAMDLSHHQAGLQAADVVANSFFNRALVSERQPKFIAMLAPLLETRRVKMRILPDS